MKHIILSIAITAIVGTSVSFSTFQYNQMIRYYIDNGDQHCPYQGMYGYYWAKECN